MAEPQPIVIARKRHSPLMRWRIGRRVAKAVRNEAAFLPEFDRLRRSIKGTFPEARGGPILLCACNDHYYREFAPTFIRSIDRLGGRERFHLHLSAPSAEVLADVARLAASLQTVELTHSQDDGSGALLPHYPTIYWAAVRFLVAPLVLEAARSEVLCLDVDGIARRPVGPALAALGEAAADVVLIKRPQEKHVRKVLASALSIRPTPGGFAFAAMLRRAVAGALALKPRYHVDQLVIHLLVERLERENRLTTAAMPLAFADHDFSDGSVIWTAKSWQRKNSPAFLAAKAAALGEARENEAEAL
ncbi:hypothetical protein [Jiella sonneratiae]|uniref:Lipopolysaccharide biosynthesis protein n=1 Tax=Jiella sonneratiae TaxID=2816856 RepID=A0ABS3J3A5_9HYPH|nr:hypothetical protein [Jiella sonneratiae]MBO0904155.1 hypothetical protein [Jiella sonneratiae]